MKRLARVASNVLTLLAVLVFAGLAIGPRTGAYRTLTVLSGSMTPVIPAGAVVAVVPTDPAQLTEGMVITYAIPVEDKRVVTHRVVDVIKAGKQPIVQTKGDANDVADAWIAQLDGGPVWVHRATIPYLGFGISFMRQPAVRTAAVLGTPLIFLVLTLAQIWGSGASQAPADRPARRKRQPRPKPAEAWLVSDPSPRRAPRLAAAGVTVIALLAATTVVGVVLAGPALALFRSTVGAQNTVTTAELSAPASVTLTCTLSKGSTSVAVSWPAAGDGLTNEYVVSRDNGTASTVLATVTTLSHTDTNVPKGTYTYAVRSKRGSWTSAATVSSPLTVQNKAGC